MSTNTKLAEALRLSDANGLPRYTVVQPELNLLDRSAATVVITPGQ